MSEINSSGVASPGPYNLHLEAGEGDEAPLVQFFSSVRNSDNARLPASRTVSFNSLESRTRV